VVVGATPQEMLALGYTQVGKDFPVFLHPESKEEYALARTERKAGHGYTGFEVCADASVTLEEDLQRRDLTINAMAESTDGKLIDPYGGEDDLANGLLKHVSPAFEEDPVRILRVARFAARFAQFGFKVAHGTNKLMRKMVDNGEVDYLVPERVWAELVKTLATQTPARFFEVLGGCGALDKLFPQLAAQYTKTVAHKNNGIYLPTLAASVELSNASGVRFAALASDMQGGNAALDDFCTQHRVPNNHRQLAEIALRHCATVQRIADLSAEDIMALLESIDAFRRGDRVNDFLLVCESRARAASPDLPDYPHADRLRAALNAAVAVKVNADGKSGKAIGEAIRQARIEAIKAI
jgi:tRNA nucleotidyltransferase (CCA-adding enzyme)